MAQTKITISNINQHTHTGICFKGVSYYIQHSLFVN